MAYSLGLIIGAIVISTTCGFGSYFIWEKHTGDKHSGKKMFFAFFSFVIAGAFGIIGGVPVLIISYAFARILKTKSPTKLSSPQQDKEAS